MNRLTAILTVSLTLASTGAMAYSINGSTETGFVLQCKDGTEFKSSLPMNHNTASEKCAGHGGIVAGYPKRIDKASPKLAEPAAPATSHNASRSNRSQGIR